MKNYGYSTFDHAMMKHALKLANKAQFISKPNPAVGCVLSKQDRIIGEGFTQKAGSNHAEIEAINDAKKNGESTENSTAYVTLEPCSHYGRTPPCAEKLIQSGIKRVVIAVPDPNPKVSGQGIQLLKQTGIETRVGLMSEKSIKKNIGFFNRMITGLPWVRAKIASTLDGKTALENSQSQWISNEKSRSDGHAWRARACAVVTGIGTVSADNPELNVRNLGDNIMQPQRVVLDSKLKIKLDAKILQGNPPPWIICSDKTFLKTEKALALNRQNITTLAFPSENIHKKANLEHYRPIDLIKTIKYLGEQSFNEIHVEAGSTLCGALLNANLIDELLLYIAPLTFGNSAKGIFQRPALSSINQAEKWVFTAIRNLDGNLRILAKRDRNNNEPWLLFFKLIEKLSQK